MQQSSSSSLIIFALLFLIAINLFILDLKVFSPANIQISEISTSIKPSYTVSAPILSATPIPTIIPSLLPTVVTETNVTNNSKIPRETYVPLGTGSTDKSGWDDLVATETVIDPANYGTIKEAYFFASLRNPTQNGQVEAQVYNVTDKHPVWGSHVILNGPKEQTITSQKITLDNGTKLYRVQLKSTMQFQAFLDNAKIRIISE